MPTVAATISMRGSSAARRQQRLAPGPQDDDGQHRGGHGPADADDDRPERAARPRSWPGSVMLKHSDAERAE